ncbi:uncharacterized protein LOC103707865 isoform X1 [Phoenix dactylifera]|uniref:Uncharacterized protein LOC103707865 isoform X1 n=2 Tax=Phoenix dactylifera TaxID=42345 RepID=A0A8B7C368_PHODC|nr:uncharacterized protein LOC103707865 isoform X1 [Phoenix dactylifera]
MSEPRPLQTLPPDSTFQSPLLNPNPNPSTSRSPASQPWQKVARAWLSTMPKNHNPTAGEIDSWIDSNQGGLPEDFRSLPRPELHRWLLSLHNRAPSLHQVEASGRVDFPYRFQRTDLWQPVYKWLESLDKDVLVSGKEISEWLSANPSVMERLFSKHSQYHMMHYIQRMHLKLLKKRGKLPKSLQLSAARASVKALNSGMTAREAPLPCKFSGGVLRDNKILLSKKKEAFLRYELLTDLQSQLTSALLRHKNVIDFKESCHSDNNTNLCSSNVGKRDLHAQVMPENASHSRDVVSVQVTEQSNPRLLLETKSGRKRKRNPVIVTPAWSYSEASCGTSQVDQPSNSHYEEARNLNIWKGDTHSSASQRSSSRNIFSCLQGREKGISWQLAYSHGAYAGRNQEKWIPFLEGWRSLENQFEGPAVWLTKRSYSSWVPTWCAYTSSMALPQPNGRQGVQKVLDVRFHPEGLPQLVCSANEAPNELLLYNLLSGRAVQLSGHNCQIQAVEFAVKGASVVSCGSNLLKVWDCITGSCLFTLGSTRDDQASVGHTQKINAMTVNSWQSCLVVTSGAKGDGKLLLWNALRGELAADLNSNLRIRDQVYPSIDAMEFGSENLLVCGSDCEYGGPAVVQVWDIESPESCVSFPANDSYITSLKTNPACNTLITGAGDGTVGLFDIRTCAAINHLSVGSSHEVTSVSFSGCGTYFTASSTSNNTLVWDTRFLPFNRGQAALGASCQSNDMRFFRPLHCLSHGKQMPTAEHAGQLPGHVDEGDQGVNDARWLQREPVLVTVSGDGSMAMWNVALGQPCVRHIINHTRCVNTVAVAPNDEYLCTGGDDQKVVLYHNNNGSAHKKWRLSHPLNGNN